jgi:hypothetical protein
LALHQAQVRHGVPVHGWAVHQAHFSNCVPGQRVCCFLAEVRQGVELESQLFKRHSYKTRRVSAGVSCSPGTGQTWLASARVSCQPGTGQTWHVRAKSQPVLLYMSDMACRFKSQLFTKYISNLVCQCTGRLFTRHREDMACRCKSPLFAREQPHNCPMLFFFFQTVKFLQNL